MNRKKSHTASELSTHTTCGRAFALAKKRPIHYISSNLLFQMPYHFFKSTFFETKVLYWNHNVVRLSVFGTFVPSARSGFTEFPIQFLILNYLSLNINERQRRSIHRLGEHERGKSNEQLKQKQKKTLFYLIH